MTLYFGGISAFRFWRSQALSPDAYGRCRSETLRTYCSDLQQLEEVCRKYPMALRGDVHLCVGSAAMRKARSHVTYSVAAPPLPARSFMRIEEGVYVASPELCFAQMADRLTPIQLMKWGMELCGDFRVDSDDGSLRTDRPALTDVERLDAFLDAYSGKRGARRAKRAARWLTDGASSVPESQLALWFRVPRKCGGGGVGSPLLNFEIALPADLQRVAGRRSYRVDEYWPGSQLVVEYESDAFHSEGAKAAADRRRRNLLQHLGCRVITVNTGQLKSLMELDNIAEQVAKAIGRRREPLPEAYRERHIEFHRELLHVDKVYLL